MKSLFLAWQDKDLSRRWFVIGRIDHTELGYSFQYVTQATDARAYGFEPMREFPDMDRIYKSSTLFPLLSNRLLPKSRPDYGEFLRRIGMDDADSDPLTILSRTEGIKMTDSFEVFPKPEPDDLGNYNLVFFARGIRHLSLEAENVIAHLNSGDRLTIVCQSGNEFDCNALLVGNDGTTVGWVPRYFCKDIRYLQQVTPDTVTLRVLRVNPPPAPIQQRLLCTLTASWPESWIPCNDRDFDPIGVEPVDGIKS